MQDLILTLRVLASLGWQKRLPRKRQIRYLSLQSNPKRGWFTQKFANSILNFYELAFRLKTRRREAGEFVYKPGISDVVREISCEPTTLQICRESKHLKLERNNFGPDFFFGGGVWNKAEKSRKKPKKNARKISWKNSLRHLWAFLTLGKTLIWAPLAFRYSLVSCWGPNEASKSWDDNCNALFDR